MKHRFQPGCTPWNRGKRGLEAGWTPERRRLASERQKKWLRDHPTQLWNSGPEYWLTGPDPEVRRLRVRFNRMRAQARFWSQEWTLKWEDYLDLYKTAPGEWERDMDALNLAREDTREGWHLWNVRLMTRREAMTRPTKGRHRRRPAGLGSKERGITWARGGKKKK